MPPDDQGDEDRCVLDPEPDEVRHEPLQAVALPVGVRQPPELQAVTSQRRAAHAVAVVGGGPHPEQDGQAHGERRHEERDPFAAEVEQRPEERQRHDRAPRVNVKRGGEPRHQPGKDECRPAPPISHRHPQQNQHDQRQAEAEERRALRHQVGEHRVQPLEVEVAIKRVLARQVHHCRHAQPLDVSEQVHESKTTAQQEHRHRDHRGGSPAREADRRQIQHRRKSETEQARAQHQ